jgi:hypothetical protein
MADDRISAVLEDVESLRNMLAAKATGERTNEAAYYRLRQRLTTHALVQDKLPRFVRTCRTLGEFWPFIKDQSATYAGRRRFLAEQFDAVLTFLEQQAATAGAAPLDRTHSGTDVPPVAAAWQAALERCASDPGGAITAARILVQTVCQHILEALGVRYADTDDLLTLHRLTAEALILSPSQHSKLVFREILGGCQTVVDGLEALTHPRSDAQGTGHGLRPAARHAELAVNLAGTMATFLLATSDSKRT